jgi:hypothetical protein
MAVEGIAVGAFPSAARFRPRAGAWLALYVYALALLAIGITRDWRLQHEDNGAMQSTFARAHLDLGLARTRAHDIFFDPRSGAGGFYGHHPPATSLVLASVFAATGSDAPWVARSVAITFQLASLTLLLALLELHFPPALVLFGGFVFATVPMSAYFGRMVNYEALCLTGVMLQLYGYARHRITGSRADFALLALGIAFGGVVDWPAFFFAAMLALVEGLAALRGERAARRRCLAIALVAGAVFLFDLAHLAFASGSLAALIAVVGSKQPDAVVTVGSFLSHEWAHGRHYFGRGAVLAGLLLAGALCFPRAPLGAALRSAAEPRTLARWLAASGLAAAAYALAAPSWAIIHAYWNFYFLPYVVTAVVLLAATAFERWRSGAHGARLAALLLVALLLDLGITSVKTLVERHTTPEPYAIRQTQYLREHFLAPRSFRPRP